MQCEATEAGAAKKSSASRSGQGPAPSASLGGFGLYADQNSSVLSGVKQIANDFQRGTLADLCEPSVIVIVLTEDGAAAMWWVEQAEREAERERNKRYREKCARPDA